MDDINMQAEKKEPEKSLSEQMARFAIDGAISYGRMGVNPPPTDDHWLMGYWKMGRELAAISPPAVTEVNMQASERERFEQCARELFVCSEQSFNRAYAEGYYNAVSSNTFHGRRQTEYAAVSMLWDIWKARAALQPAVQVPPGWQSIIESLHERMEGFDQNQPGWHRRSGWNDALRRVADIFNALSAAAPSPSPQRGE